MAFDPVYVRERDFYSVGDLARLLRLDIGDALACVRALASRGVLTLRSDAAPEGDDADEELAALGKYQFTWVGLARWRRALICVYPKYYPEGERPSEAELAQIFRVLRKSSGGLAGIGATPPGAKEDGGPLALMLALLSSYEENGVYTNYVRVIRDNGTGEIAWDRTIAQNQPFMDGDTPAYFDLKTHDTSRDAADLVTRLHRCVLTRCSADLRRWGIDELLGLAPVELSGEELEDLGEPEALTYRLEQERSVQFVTWKQDVIDMLLRYLNPSEEYESPEEEFCLGTTSFYHAWELACKTAFGDRLSDRIDSLDFPLADRWRARGAETLLSIIPRPEWRDAGGAGCGDVDTLIPDVIGIHGDGGDGRVFCVYDAKYYVPSLSPGRAVGVPGVESVTKQVLYQSAYEGFIRDNGFSAVANVFLVPTRRDEALRMGGVRFPGVFGAVEPPLTDGVEMWALPAAYVFGCYLDDRLADEGLIRKVCGIEKRGTQKGEHAQGL
ncbi:LlaJI family restriction endonuclease [Atopobiaceae bacterium LCP21S3_F11]